MLQVLCISYYCLCFSCTCLMHSLFLLDGLPMCTAVFLALACLHFAEPGSCLFCWLLGPELNPVDDSGLTLCRVYHRLTVQIFGPCQKKYEKKQPKYLR